MFGGAAADGGGHLDSRQLAAALDEEEQELWRQLRRKRDFEGRVAEKRAQLAELRDKRRTVSSSCAEAKASVEHLSQELEFAEEQRRDLDHDIAVLKESNKLLQQALFQHDQQEHRDWDPQRILAEERKRQESMQLQQEQIAHHRAHIEKLRIEKSNLQQRQQVLFERQRSAEQDRNRLLGTLQDERSAINEVRQERIKLWEERTKMEQEMAQIVRNSAAQGRGGAGFDPRRSDAARGVPGASGGVRGRVEKDTPQVFADTTKMDSWGSPSFAGSAAGDAASRPGWTSFGSAPASRPSGSSPGGAGGGLSSLGGGLGGGFGGAFPGGSTGGGANVPPSFGDLGGGGLDDGGGITDWSGKMDAFRG